MTTKKITTKQNSLSSQFTFLLAGTSVNIDITTPAGELGRFKTTFIGYLPQQYLFIQYPNSDKIGKFGQFFVKGTAVTVRGLIEGHEASVIAFQTTIKHTLSIPVKMLVLDFPQTMVIHKLRSAKRVLTELPCTIKFEDQELAATMTDVSLSGCHINIIDGGIGLLETSSIVTITMNADENNKNTLLSVTCKICNLKPYFRGVEFGGEFDSNQTSTIESIIHMALLSER
ncbi:flagellar brake domain-containing protein [Shewanella aestuarii]|uniref:Flagellar brake protein n=1 Tax=Shewanella aestuarii TaxID=1028752 RepID=A0A6G9QMC0_9GAMM|nr:flagellar brake protein [Shewanella aestuarii]QIR15632.1 flagellar brake protein [Shewanella aestuarii]